MYEFIPKVIKDITCMYNINWKKKHTHINKFSKGYHCSIDHQQNSTLIHTFKSYLW